MGPYYASFEEKNVYMQVCVYRCQILGDCQNPTFLSKFFRERVLRRLNTRKRFGIALNRFSEMSR